MAIRFNDGALDAPPAPNEAAIRAILEQSRRDIAAGRVVPLGPVLDRMRAAADGIRLGRSTQSKAGRRLAWSHYRPLVRRRLRH